MRKLLCVIVTIFIGMTTACIEGKDYEEKVSYALQSDMDRFCDTYYRFPVSKDEFSAFLRNLIFAISKSESGVEDRVVFERELDSLIASDNARLNTSFTPLVTLSFLKNEEVEFSVSDKSCLFKWKGKTFDCVNIVRERFLSPTTMPMFRYGPIFYGENGVLLDGMEEYSLQLTKELRKVINLQEYNQKIYVAMLKYDRENGLQMVYCVEGVDVSKLECKSLIVNCMEAFMESHSNCKCVYMPLYGVY